MIEYISSASELINNKSNNYHQHIISITQIGSLHAQPTPSHKTTLQHSKYNIFFLASQPPYNAPEIRSPTGTINFSSTPAVYTIYLYERNRLTAPK